MKTIHLLTLGVLIALLCGATGCAVTHKFVSTTTAIFATVRAAVNTRAKNLATLAQDQAAFRAQKDSSGGCITFNEWLWKQEGDAYDKQQNG